jgi:hypothetical protein
MQALLRMLTALALAGAAAAAGAAATLPPLAPAGAGTAAADGGFVVVAHPGVAKVDAATLQRLYTGRAIEVGGQPVSVVNLAPGAAARDRFLAQVLGQDNDRYVAYWTVRRHVGKGIPPREFRTPAEVLEHVRNTPGAIGYVPTADAKGAPNIVYRP